jgi:Ca2+-binding RTX toxin-like protein
MPDATRTTGRVDANLVHAEPLEARRLLAVSFNEATGVLTVDGTDGNDVVQFETVGNSDGITGFYVREAVATSVPSGNTNADFETFLLANLGPQGTLYEVPDQGDFPEAGEVRVVVINAGDGNDMIVAGNTLPVPLDIVGGGGNDTISGGPRADTVISEGGDDYIFGGGGADVMTGGEGSDTLIGGDGNDTADYRSREQDVDVSLDGIANDGEAGEFDLIETDIETIVGGEGNDTISAQGISFDVELVGNFGDDIITGGSGNDTLIGGPGEDTLVGQAGRDFYFAFDDDVDTIDANAADAGQNDFGEAGEDVIFADEDGTVDIVTSEGNELFSDDVRGDDSPSQDDELTGEASIDDDILMLTGSNDDDRIEVFAYGDGRIFATVRSIDASTVRSQASVAEDDLDGIEIRGLDGDDRIITGGIDLPIFLSGGEGDDLLIGSRGGDVLRGGRGVNEGTEDDPQFTTGGDDFLIGGAGDDFLEPGFGADYIAGGEGSDRLDYQNRIDDLVVGLGVLSDDGSREEGDDAQVDIELILGGSGNDDLSTISDNDVSLFGFAGNDTLTGGSGNDIFDGGTGTDQLFGLGGDDQFFSIDIGSSFPDGEVDTLFGGEGNDAANADRVDELNDIESTSFST